MGKLPKSSRPGRRKPSETFKHPYQLDFLEPASPSTLKEIGAVAKLLIAAYGGLAAWYWSSSNQLPDTMLLKKELMDQGNVLVWVLSALLAVEVPRILKWFDIKRLGNWPKYAMVTICAAALAYLIFAYRNYGAQTSMALQSRIEETAKKAQEADRKAKAAEAECNTQRTREIDALVKRRQAAFADHKKCMTDWVKPGMLSTETADQACQAKQRDFQGLVQAVKAREAKECTAAAMK